MKDKKTLIIEASIDLFAREGLSVSTARIAKEAGVSNGTLFNYFATKQALLDGIYLAIRQEAAGVVLPLIDRDMPARELFAAIWHGYIGWALENRIRHEVRLLLKSGRAISREMCESADDVFHVAIADSLNNPLGPEIREAPASFLYHLGAAQMNAAICFATLQDLQGDTLEKHIDLSFDLFWNGAGPR